MHLSETFYVFTRATRGLCRHVVSVFVCRRKIHWFQKMLLFSIYYDKWRGYRGKPFRNSGVTRRLAVLNWRSSSIHPSSSFCFSALLVFSWLLCAWLSVGNSAQEIDWKRVVSEMTYMYKQSKAKQRCVMGVGMCLYAQLVQTNNTWCNYNALSSVFIWLLFATPVNSTL